MKNLKQLRYEVEFFEKLGQLLAAGLEMEIVDIMNILKDEVGNAAFQESIKEATSYMANNCFLHEALQKTNMFYPSIVSLISNGERCGMLDKFCLVAVKCLQVDIDKSEQLKKYLQEEELIEHIVFFQKLAFMLDAGVSLMDCLNSFIQETDNKKMIQLIEQILENIPQANSFADAIPKGSFSQSVITLIKAGEKTGAMDIMLLRVVSILKAEWESCKQ